MCTPQLVGNVTKAAANANPTVVAGAKPNPSSVPASTPALASKVGSTQTSVSMTDRSSASANNQLPRRVTLGV